MGSCGVGCDGDELVGDCGGVVGHQKVESGEVEVVDEGGAVEKGDRVECEAVCDEWGCIAGRV